MKCDAPARGAPYTHCFNVALAQGHHGSVGKAEMWGVARPGIPLLGWCPRRARIQMACGQPWSGPCSGAKWNPLVDFLGALDSGRRGLSPNIERVNYCALGARRGYRKSNSNHEKMPFLDGKLPPDGPGWVASTDASPANSSAHMEGCTRQK